MQRPYRDDHEALRESFRKFCDAEIAPYHAQWERDHIVPKDLWLKAGAAGFLLPAAPEEYGGAGGDFGHSAVIMEELAKIHATGPGFSLHSDIVAPYLLNFGSDEQKETWLPKMARGEVITAIAMTEPGTGSDLQAVRTKAVLDGDEWVINGSKTFISNGLLCGLCIVVCDTDDGESGSASKSLIVVEADAPGFVRGKHLDKMGMRAQDTTELHFEDCRVPKDNLLGDRGAGFLYLMEKLGTERYIIASGCVAAAEAIFEETVTYCKERQAFGKPIGKFQYNRFKLAELKTEIDVAAAFVDRVLSLHLSGDNITVPASQAKYWASEMLGRVVDACVQLHGGYGFMNEYPVAKAYVDARVQRIYGGTTEIMKEIIGRSIL